MRASRLLARHALVVAIALSGTIAIAPDAARSAAPFVPSCPTRDLGGNPLPNSGLYQCAAFKTPGARGSIYVVGDSVLLGSADGYSQPGLGALLQQQHWGPVVVQAALGMRAWWDLAAHPHERFKRGSAAWMIDHWQQLGWKPSVIAVNVGANEIGTCTRATVSRCRSQIEKTLTAAGSNVQVWWAKMNFTSNIGKVPSLRAGYEGMRGWNLALDQAAKAHPNLVVWDWPTALATSNPTIKTDGWGIHPASKLEYVKRSRLMAAHITSSLPASHTGAAQTVPTAAATGLRFVPVERTATDGDLLWTGDVAASTTTTVAVSVPGVAAAGTRALVLTVATSSAAGAGALTLTSCSLLNAPPAGRLPRLAFGVGTDTSTQTIVPVAAGTFCLRADKAVHVTIAVQGSLVSGPDASPDALALTAANTPLEPVPAATAASDATPIERVVSGSAVSVQVAVGPATGTTTVWVAACGSPRSATPTAVARPNTVTTAVAYLSAASGSLCVTRSNTTGTLPKVWLTVSGTFGATGATFSAVDTIRMLDTGVVSGTSGIGGWYGRVVKSQQVGSPAAPVAAIATGIVSVALPTVGGPLSTTNCATSSTLSISVAPLVNASAAVSAGTSNSGALCFVSSGANAYVAFDLSGWWS